MARLFLDANVPTYAAAWDHPPKQPCLDILLITARHPASYADIETWQKRVEGVPATGRGESSGEEGEQ